MHFFQRGIVSRKFIYFSLRIILAAIAISAIVILTQSIQIFPGAVFSLFSGTTERTNLPEHVESIFIETADHQRLELWRLPVADSKQVAVIFHGNAGDVANFFPYQQHFAQAGISSYGFDYRGFGRSSGWPTTERGLYLDAEAVVDYVLDREGIKADSLIITGISIGSGPATYITNKIEPGAVMLFSPFISLPEVIRTVPLFGLLYRFSFYQFPVLYNVAALQTACLIVIHGERDDIIPVEQGKAVFAAYQGSGYSELIISEVASHNDLLFRLERSFSQILQRCKFKNG